LRVWLTNYRHSHLLLFDNADQLEVRHVIALENYDVDVYGGGDAIPEGELWIKRNCIRLSRKGATDALVSNAIPFYLFSENCSEKEDFYHALLSNQDRKPTANDSPPESLLFNTDDMIKLIRQLHTSEENSQTRWLNALLGRLFLAIYKMPETEELIRMKITKKISRVPKPTFITSLRLEAIDMGNSAPMLSNPKLKELAIDGSLVVEADIKYTGNFKIVIAAVARIELGARFKAREVDLVLAAVLKKLEGHILIRIKPPPSNRFWISFETMPKIDLSIEPVVSTRQITYGVILRAIESRVREVIAETVVLPNWDDTPFTDTLQQLYRGGIWQTDKTSKSASFLENITKEASAQPSDHEEDLDSITAEPESKVVIPAPITTGQSAEDNAPSVDVPALPQDTITEPTPIPSSPLRSTPTKRPKALRSSSFAAAAKPVVSGGSAVSDAVIHHTQTTQKDAASTMKILSSRTPEASLGSSPIRPSSMELAAAAKQPEQKDVAATVPLDGNKDSSAPISETVGLTDSAPSLPPRVLAVNLDRETLPAAASISPPQPSPAVTAHEETAVQRSASSTSATSRVASTDRREVLNQTLNNASSAAKKWGLGVLQNWQESKGQGKDRRPSETPHTEPFGRGQPLPPPGTPLPKPETPTFFGSVKRKPMPPTAPSPQATLAATLAASMHSRQGSTISVDRVDTAKEGEEVLPPLPRRAVSSESEAIKRALKKDRID